MKPEQQRIAIAEACGWSHEDAKRGHTLSQFSELVPDYLSDLNAMHEAEKAQGMHTLGNPTQYKYELALAEILYQEGVRRCIVSATAAQRGEAFLRTLNFWVE